MQNPAIVAAKAPVMFAAIPGERVGNVIRLVELATRSRIGEPAERGKADAGDTEVERVGGNAGDPREAGDVDVVRVEIRSRNVIVIVGEAKNVGAAAVAVGPAGAGLQALRVCVAGERWKRIHKPGVIARIVETKVDVVLRAATATAAATSTAAEQTVGGITKIVNEPKADRVGVAVVVGDVVKVLRRGVEIGQRDVREQGFRLRADQRGIDDIGLTVEAVLRAGGGIENLDWRPIIVCSAREIAGAFGRGRHGGVSVVRSAATRAIPSCEKEPLTAAVENVRNVERAAGIGSEAREIVAGFRSLDAGERVGLRVKGRIVVGKVKETVRLVDVEAAAKTTDRDRAATAKTAGTTETPSAAPTRAALRGGAGN